MRGSAPGRQAPRRGRRAWPPTGGCARRSSAVAGSAGYTLHVPPPALCTDNAAMVAWAGAERLARGWTDGLEIAARARWPLDPEATPALGFGRLGAKA